MASFASLRTALRASAIPAATLIAGAWVTRPGDTAFFDGFHSGKPCRCEVRDFDVVVVGGGIAGLATALHLARAKRRVFLVEKEAVGGGATGMSCATICSPGYGNGTEFKAVLAAATLETLRELQGASQDLGLVECGVLELISSRSEMDFALAEVDSLKSRGADVSMLSVEEAHSLEPALRASPGLLGAMHIPGSGYADPGLTMAALEAAAVQAGVEIGEYHCLVGARLADENARRWQVRVAPCAAGQAAEICSVSCDDIVLAPGAWAAEIGRHCGLELPVVKVKAQMWSAEVPATDDSGSETTCPLSHVIYSAGSHSFWSAHHTQDWLHHVPNNVTHSASGSRYCHHVYGRPDPNNSSHVWFGGDRLPLAPGPFTSSDYIVDEVAAAENFDKVASLLPALRLDGQEYGAWSGVVGPTMHGTALVGELAYLPGLWLCTGFGGSGFMQGVGAGEAVAAWLTGSDQEGKFAAVRLALDPSPWVSATMRTG